MRFIVNKGVELTPEKIIQIIQQFQTSDKPKLEKYYKYYKGDQDIMRKAVKDSSKPCNRIVSNYCYNITQNYLGYLAGLPITYTSQDDMSAIQNVLNYNDVDNEDSELLRNALIYGRAFEVCYLDEIAQQRFTVLDSRECIPVYDNTLNQELLYVIRFYITENIGLNNVKYQIDVYSADSIKSYETDGGFSSCRLLGEVKHYYKQVPVTVFSLNTEEESIFDKVMTLQDAYNNLLSSEVDDFSAFVDAYLILKGITADEEDLADMKEKRILLLDEGAEASYLSKNISDTQIENMLSNINDTIHKIANSPDFNDEKFMAQSGIALRYKLVGFENTSSAIVSRMTKALQKRIELITEIMNLTGESMWRDIEIHFTRNLPVNTLEIAQMVNQLRGLVSDATLLSQLPFVTDVDRELEILQEQKTANLDMYGFNTTAQTQEEVVNG